MGVKTGRSDMMGNFKGNIPYCRVRDWVSCDEPVREGGSAEAERGKILSVSSPIADQSTNHSR